jgi:hypothetical protein
MGLARWGGVCRKVRAAAVLAAAMTAAAVVGFTGAASADVQLQPGEFHQADAAQFKFLVTNTGPAPMTRVEMRMPTAYPIAEIYPMSVDGWAPQVTMTPLDKPMTDQHGGEVTQVVTAITWWAMPGSELAQGAKAELTQSMWVLPAIDRMEIGIVETYANGAVVNSTITVTLAPPVAAPDSQNTGDDAAATEPAADSSGSNLWWMFGLLILIGAVTAVALLRQRRVEPVDDEPVDDEPAEATAPRATKVRGGTAGTAAKKTASGTAAKKTASVPAKKTASGSSARTATKAAAKATSRAPVKAADKRIRAGR